MAKVKFAAKDVQWIEIVGEKRSGADTSRLPMTRDDAGLVSRFLKWCGEQEIYPTWLEENGARGVGERDPWKS